MSSLTDRQLEIRRKLRDDLPHYSDKCLKIRTKGGVVAPLVLNRAQWHVHVSLERQRAETGKVRALILKGRQQGCSTYVGARFYQRTTHGRGLRTFILTHEDQATQNLFEMVNRFHEHCPDVVRPSTGTANAKELFFDRLDSGYKVGTAGTKGVGRSSTLQLFHGCCGILTPVICGATGSIRKLGEMRVGDLVMTHTGKLAPIKFISTQTKPTVSVTMKGMRDFPFTVTLEHRFWTPSGWRGLGDLASGDVIGFPIRPIVSEITSLPFKVALKVRPQGGGSVEHVPDSVPLDYDLGRIVGLYLAEGCIIRQATTKAPSGIAFAVHEREVERTVAWLQSISGLLKSARVAPRPASKTVVVNAYGRSLAEWMERLVGSKDEKRFPFEWWRMGEDFVRGIVHGYTSGDGHFSPQRDRRISVTSIRSATITGLREALAGLGYGWSSVEYKPAGVRHGRNEREAWTLRLTGGGVERLSAELGKPFVARQRPDNGGYGTVVIRDGYAWVPIVSINEAGEQEVRDFEIDHEDHSYCLLQGATHNSEVAFWPHAEAHAAGILQAIPDASGTESILESTANGIGNYFHTSWRDAEASKTEYIPIFVPWFWQDEYRRPIPAEFAIDEEEREYMDAYGLTEGQMVWRRAKISELRDPLLFKQEYPATAAEAFQMSGHDSFIKPELILRARKFACEGIGPLVCGVDPARFGDDRFSIAWRKGRRLEKIESKNKIDTVAGANWCRRVVEQEKPKRMFVDVGGQGAGVYDLLVSWGFGEEHEGPVRAVNFGGEPFYPQAFDENSKPIPGPRNRRAEMWQQSRDWLSDVAGASIPDLDSLQADACGPTYHYDSSQRLLIESKEHMRARGVRSPDEWDAIVLTFAEPIAPDRVARKQPARNRSAWGV